MDNSIFKNGEEVEIIGNEKIVIYGHYVDKSLCCKKTVLFNDNVDEIHIYVRKKGNCDSYLSTVIKKGIFTYSIKGNVSVNRIMIEGKTKKELIVFIEEC